MNRKVWLTVICCFLLAGFVYAQEEQPTNDIYFINFIKPHNDSIKDFENAVSDHNNQFHKEQPVLVFYLITGELHGYYQFVQGPHTWAEMGAMEQSDEHDQHWYNEVMPHVASEGEPQAWKHMPDIQLNPVEEITTNSVVTILTIKPGTYPRFMRILNEWHEANVEGGDTGNYNVYQRQMAGESQIAIVTSLTGGLAELDESSDFRGRFEETHGKMNWDLFLDDANLSVAGEDVVMRVFRADLSSPMETTTGNP